MERDGNLVGECVERISGNRADGVVMTGLRFDDPHPMVEEHLWDSLYTE